MDIMEVVKKVTADKALMEKVQKDPAGAVKELTGMELSQEQIQQVLEAVKGNVDLNKLNGAAGMLGNLFGKK